MITVTLTGSPGSVTGFYVEGHAMADGYGKDIVCAAVSSAAYMAANTVTDILRVKATAAARDGSMTLCVEKQDAPKAKDILAGFELHMKALAGQYPRNLTIKYTEG